MPSTVMSRIIKSSSKTVTNSRAAIIDSLKKALMSLPRDEIEFISQVNATPIDLLPRASVLAPLYLSPNNEKVVHKVNCSLQVDLINGAYGVSLPSSRRGLLPWRKKRSARRF